MNICFLSSDWSPIVGPDGKRTPGGAGWWRCKIPADALAAAGHHVFHECCELGQLRSGELAPADMDRNVLASGFDVVVLQRVMHAGLAGDIRQARAAGQVIVSDVDDWYDGLDPNNQAFLATHPRGGVTRAQARRGARLSDLELAQRYAEVNRNHHRAVLGASTLITVSTPYLAERLGRLAPTVLLPNRIDLARWHGGPARDWDELRVGWVGATGWRSGDLETLRGVLGPFLDRHGGRFVHRGHREGDPAAADLLGLRPDQVAAATGMVSILDYPDLFAGFDIGIVPLRDTPFNHAKCLDADTRVATGRGVLPLSEIRVGDVVCADKWRVVEAVLREPAGPGIQITTGLGYRLRLTPDHRLFIGGEWRPAGDARVGESVALARHNIDHALPLVRAPWPSDSRRTRYGHEPDIFRTAEDVPTVAITERWGRLLGLFVSDGSASGKTSVCFAMDGQDADLINLVMDDLRQIGLQPGTEQATTWAGKVLRRRHIRVASAHLRRFLANLGLVDEQGGSGIKGDSRRIVRVPEVIWRSPAHVVAAFLAGVFEGDGTATAAAVELSAKGRDYLGHIQILLAGYGITGAIRPHHLSSYPDRVYWKLRLRRAELDLFAKHIGFLSERKQARLETIGAKPHSNAYRPISWSDVVAQIEPCWVQPIDLQVAGSVFAAAGILSHNSAIKGMEYAAAGIPFVAGWSPAYEAYDPASTARRPAQWIARLEALADPAGWVAEALRGRDVVAGHDIADHWPDWENLYMGAVMDAVHATVG